MSKGVVSKTVGRALVLLIAGAAVTATIASVWSLSPRDSNTQAAAWGEEVLLQAREHVSALSPIAAANACGMGASSCFKCHNGTRAKAPGMDKQKDPWHVQHQTVNYSCAGCHHGNPRLIKKELAHAELIKDSRTRPDTCESCHKGQDVGKLLKTYQK